MKHNKALGVGAVAAIAIAAGFLLRPASEPISEGKGMRPVTLSPLAVPVGRSETPQAPVVANPSSALAKPMTQDQEFDRLVAGSPAQRSKAYAMVKECLEEQIYLTMPSITFHRECFLAPGKWQDLELRKQLAMERGLRGEPGSFMALRDEGPDGRFRAFSEAERTEFEDLLAQTCTKALENNDSDALAAESVRQGALGNTERALALNVAAMAALHTRVGMAYDPSNDPTLELPSVQAKIGASGVNQAIVEGLKMASTVKAGELK